MRMIDWSSDVCSSDLVYWFDTQPPIFRHREDRPDRFGRWRCCPWLLVDRDRAGMMLVEVALDDLEVAAVRAENQVEGIADERDCAERGVEAKIADRKSTRLNSSH